MLSQWAVASINWFLTHLAYDSLIIHPMSELKSLFLKLNSKKKSTNSSQMEPSSWTVMPHFGRQSTDITLMWHFPITTALSKPLPLCIPSKHLFIPNFVGSNLKCGYTKITDANRGLIESCYDARWGYQRLEFCIPDHQSNNWIWLPLNVKEGKRACRPYSVHR